MHKGKKVSQFVIIVDENQLLMQEIVQNHCMMNIKKRYPQKENNLYSMLLQKR